MARVCNIEKLDNGYILQTAVSDEMGKAGLEGMKVTTSPAEVLAWVAELLGVTAVAATPEKKVAAAAAPDPEAKVVQFPQQTLPSGAPLPAGVPAPTGAAPENNPEKIEVPDDVPAFDSGEYHEELKRIVAENDRDAAKARLKVYEDAGVTLDLDKPVDSTRMGAKNLIKALYAADRDAAQTQMPLEGETQTASTQGDGAFAVPTVPVTPTCTLADVGAALSAAASKGEEQNAAAIALLTSRKVGRVSDLPEDQWATVIAEANAIN